MVVKSLHRSVDLVNSVGRSLVTNQLIRGREKVLLSVSGGQDSICLLVVLNQLHAQMELYLGLLWCHHLWQTDSFLLMRQMAKISYLFQLNSCFAVAPKPVPSELLARNWRQNCSYRISSFYNYYKIALAHSANDKTETILLNLMRGTGVTGLSPLRWEKKISELKNFREEHISQFFTFQNSVFLWSPFCNNYKNNEIVINQRYGKYRIKKTATVYWPELHVYVKRVNKCNSFSLFEMIEQLDENYLTLPIIKIDARFPWIIEKVKLKKKTIFFISNSFSLSGKGRHKKLLRKICFKNNNKKWFNFVSQTFLKKCSTSLEQIQNNPSFIIQEYGSSGCLFESKRHLLFKNMDILMNFLSVKSGESTIKSRHFFISKINNCWCIWSTFTRLVGNSEEEASVHPIDSPLVLTRGVFTNMVVGSFFTLYNLIPNFIIIQEYGPKTPTSFYIPIPPVLVLGAIFTNIALWGTEALYLQIFYQTIVFKNMVTGIRKGGNEERPYSYIVMGGFARKHRSPDHQITRSPATIFITTFFPLPQRGSGENTSKVTTSLNRSIQVQGLPKEMVAAHRKSWGSGKINNHICKYEYGLTALQVRSSHLFQKTGELPYSIIPSGEEYGPQRGSTILLKKNCSTIRPLLSLNRFEISKLCTFWHLPVYPDKSNQKVNFLRNRVRKQLLPTIKLFFNSRIENVLLQFAEIFFAEDYYLNQITNKLFQKCHLAQVAPHFFQDEALFQRKRSKLTLQPLTIANTCFSFETVVTIFFVSNTCSTNLSIYQQDWGLIHYFPPLLSMEDFYYRGGRSDATRLVNRVGLFTNMAPDISNDVFTTTLLFKNMAITTMNDVVTNTGTGDLRNNGITKSGLTKKVANTVNENVEYDFFTLSLCFLQLSSFKSAVKSKYLLLDLPPSPHFPNEELRTSLHALQVPNLLVTNMAITNMNDVVTNTSTEDNGYVRNIVFTNMTSGAIFVNKRGYVNTLDAQAPSCENNYKIFFYNTSLGKKKLGIESFILLQRNRKRQPQTLRNSFSLPPTGVRGHYTSVCPVTPVGEVTMINTTVASHTIRAARHKKINKFLTHNGLRSCPPTLPFLPFPRGHICKYNASVAPHTKGDNRLPLQVRGRSKTFKNLFISHLHANHSLIVYVEHDKLTSILPWTKLKLLKPLQIYVTLKFQTVSPPPGKNMAIYDYGLTALQVREGLIGKYDILHPIKTFPRYSVPMIATFWTWNRKLCVVKKWKTSEKVKKRGALLCTFKKTLNSNINPLFEITNMVEKKAGIKKPFDQKAFNSNILHNKKLGNDNILTKKFLFKFEKFDMGKKEIYWPLIIYFLPIALQRRFIKLFLVNENGKQVGYSQIEHFLAIIKKLSL